MQIGFLAQRPQSVPSLASWFVAEWPEYYGKRTTTDVEKDFRKCLNTERLPIGLVAYDGDRPCGVIVLRERILHRGEALTLYRWQADAEHFRAPGGLRL